MKKRNIKSINELCKFVSCVNIVPLPNKIIPMIEEAVDCWNEIWKGFVPADYEEKFLNGFRQMIELLNKDKKDNEAFDILYSYGKNCHRIVWSIEWINTFARELPKADLENQKQYKDIANQMITIFYYEYLLKAYYRKSEESMDQHLSRCMYFLELIGNKI